jgi:hypothetical protein
MPLELEMQCWPHLNFEIFGHNQVAKIAHTMTKIPYNNAFLVTKQSTCTVIDEIIHTCVQGMRQGLLLQDVKIKNIHCHNCSTCLNFYKFTSDQRRQYTKQANMYDTNVKMWRLLLTLFRGIVRGELHIGIIQMMFTSYLWKLVFLVNHHLNCRLF